jgi:DNA primase
MGVSVSDEIKQRIDIVEFISRYTPLKKAGKQYKGCCPFHSERTPSFYVYPDQGSWHCYGACSTGGDVFSFLMKKENLDFREALQALARETGIDLAQEQGDGLHRQRESLHDLNAAAAAFFAAMLRDNPGAAEARDYLRRRGIDAETEERFGLGYAPAGWNALRDYLYEKGYDYETQLLAGVVKRHEEQGNYYDAFRNRVIIPIRDRMGRVIGFGGRVLDDSQPKYLNTAETPVFRKSQVVFGIDAAHAAIREADRAVIVEGYMDVVAAHQYGFTNVVACMGTALTPQQLRQLQRDTRNFVFALDADSAGREATIRGLNQARESLSKVSRMAVNPGGKLRLEERLSAELSVSSMPEGMDPDDVIRQDPARWQALIEQAQPLVDFFFRVISERYDLSSGSGKAAAASVLAPLIAELGDEIEQQHYVQKLSRLVSVPEMTIAARVQAASATRSIPFSDRAGYRSQGGRGAGPLPWPGEDASWRENGDPESGSGISAPKIRYRLDQEDYLLAHLLHQPESMIWLTAQAQEHNIGPPRAEDWQHVENQEIYRALKLFLAGDEQWDPELFQDKLPEWLHVRLRRLLAAAESWPVHNEGELRSDMLKVLVRIRIDRLKSDNLGIKFAIDEAQREGDREAIRSFDAINNRNLRELNHLQSTLAELTRVLAAQGHPRQGVKIR